MNNGVTLGLNLDREVARATLGTAAAFSECARPPENAARSPDIDRAVP